MKPRLFALALFSGSLISGVGLVAQMPAPAAVALPVGADLPGPPSLIALGTRVGSLPTSYEDGGRRDPFMSLVAPKRLSAARAAEARRPRTGLASLSLADVAIRGIMKAGASMSAILEGPDKQSFIVHVKDRLADAVVQSIDADGVVFVEESSGPGAKPNQLRKTLRPAGEDVR